MWVGRMPGAEAAGLRRGGSLGRFGGCVAAVVVAVLGLPGAALAASAQTFVYTGSEQTYTVPAGVTEVNITAVGAQGGGGCMTVRGGRGGQISADFAVTPGENLYVEVGGRGGLVPGICQYGGTTAGRNGGGTGGPIGGGGGGGASDVRTLPLAGSGTLSSRMIVAGGGGGGGTPALGGDAGSQGADGSGGLGGGAGTVSGPGAAGTPIGSGCGRGNSTAGGLGTGGTGGGANTTTKGGGGGGGGYYGGGGGGACIGQTTTGGGGGGGSSYVAPSAMNATAAVPTSQASSVTITPVTALVLRPAAGLLFPGTQAEQTVSAPQTLTVQNTGGGTIHISGVTFSGADPQDFAVSANTCLGPLATGATCTVGVTFAPQGQGARDATLSLASDDVAGPASVPVSGTGGPPLAHPAGTPGTGGTSKVERVTCTTVTKRIKRAGREKTRRVKVITHVCRTKVLSGTVTLPSTATGERASISRGRLVYASGIGVSIGTGRWQLTLTDVHPLRPGRYTLTLVRRRGHRTITTRLRVTIARAHRPRRGLPPGVSDRAS